MSKIQKKPLLIAWILAIAFLMLPFLSSSAQAELTSVNVASDHALLIDADTGAVLYEKSAQQQAFPASTTKIMTAILVIENTTDFNELITVGKEVDAFGPQNSRMLIQTGEQLRVIDLLYGTMLLSGNDAAATLAIHVGGSIEGFADMMNAKAAELGMNDTHYTNPHGLHNKDHYTTAADMAKLTQYAMQNDMFRQIVATPSYQTPPTNKHENGFLINTTNRFISRAEKNLSYNWKPVTGVKTGQTSAAGGCLVASASKDGVNLISVVLGDRSKNSVNRWTETRALLEEGFNNYKRIPLSDLHFEEQAKTAVLDASRKDPESGLLALSIDPTNVSISGLSSELDEIASDPSRYKVIFSINNNGTLVAPIQQGEVCGTATFVLDNGRTLATANLVASRAVESVETDPKNPVDSLIQNVMGPGDGGSPVGIIIAIILVLVIIFLIVVLVVRKNRFEHAKKQRAKKAARQRKYYDYRNNPRK